MRNNQTFGELLLFTNCGSMEYVSVRTIAGDRGSEHATWDKVPRGDVDGALGPTPHAINI